jgi:hypothetical protein
VFHSVTYDLGITRGLVELDLVEVTSVIRFKNCAMNFDQQMIRNL